MTEPTEQNEIPVSNEMLDDEVARQTSEAQHNEQPGIDANPGEPAGSEIEQLRQQLAQAEKDLLRSQADMENFRRRTRKDNEDRVRYAAMPLVTELIEIVDNLNRAVESAQTSGSDQGMIEGVKMVSQQIADVLAQSGCKPIDAVGSTFDPNKHEAIRMEPSDEFEPNVVTQETRTGYTLHERVVRPAQVFVSTGLSDQQTESQESD